MSVTAHDNGIVEISFLMMMMMMMMMMIMMCDVCVFIYFHRKGFC